MLLVDVAQNTFGFPEKRALISEDFVFSNFNYCPLVWYFTSMTSTDKIESIQKRALRLLHDDYTSNYDSLLAKSNKPSMEIKRYRTLALETLNVSRAGPLLFALLICKTPK